MAAYMSFACSGMRRVAALAVVMLCGAMVAHAAETNVSEAEKRRIGQMLVAQIVKCWSPPPGALETGVRATLVVELNRDGTLKGDPAIETVTHPDNPMANSIVKSAVRAVKMCGAQQPFKLPADKYGAWAVNHITFDPKTL